MEDNKREALLARIRALQQKTTANGCTEAEALAAAALVAKLLDRYGFSRSDLEIKLEPIIEMGCLGPNGKPIGELVYTVLAIAAYYDCKCWQQETLVRDPRNPQVAKIRKGVVYFGKDSDVACCIYLTHLCYTALQSGWKDYLANVKLPGTKNNPQRRDFMRGMAVRLAERLREMKAARNAEHDPASGRTGNALVVVKNALVEEEFAARWGGKVDAEGKMSRWKVSQATLYGEAAANKVAINPGVGAKNAPKAIA